MPRRTLGRARDTGAAGPGWLDPAVVASLGSMELRARTVVEGFLLGLHRSPYTGFSVEFSEYRPYIPGDDLSTLDWKVYARLDRYYVKRFEEDTNLECRLLLDISASMSYGSGPVSKLEYGSYLAAALAWLMERQRDAVGLATFDDRVVADIPPGVRPGHLRRILIALDHLEAGRQSDVAAPLNRLAASMRRRSMVVVISDLLDDPERVIGGLRHLKFGRNDVVVFHLLDPAELAFPFEPPTRFEDLETGETITGVAAELRDGYLREMDQLLECYARELPLSGIEYRRVDTSQPLDDALRAYFSSRIARG
ncbi:MAG: DUF58 domain-containing protein [Acidobacteria bacterium]|nr:DUF58 domain-containing protein [Acidobacteriota bacterium]